MTVEMLATAGGLFAILTFVHFFADWIFQSDKEAKAKSHDAWVRAKHCGLYVFWFAPVLLWMGLTGWRYGAAVALLFLSHFVIDTYLPVLLWAKYFRRFPQFFETSTVTTANALGVEVRPGVLLNTNGGSFVVVGKVSESQLLVRPANGTALKAVFETPLGALLCITVDQILHLTMLWGVVVLALWK